jgi:hypothetical protein
VGGSKLKAEGSKEEFTAGTAKNAERFEAEEEKAESKRGWRQKG